MEKREDTVLDMDIYRFERNGARENAGSNPEDVRSSVQINVPSTPDPVFSLTQFPSKGYVSLQGICLLSLPRST
jgi:hypothetical protein